MIHVWLSYSPPEHHLHKVFKSTALPPNVWRVTETWRVFLVSSKSETEKTGFGGSLKPPPAKPCGIPQWFMQVITTWWPKENMTCVLCECVRVRTRAWTCWQITEEKQSCRDAPTNSKCPPPPAFPESLKTATVWTEVHHVPPRTPAWISPWSCPFAKGGRVSARESRPSLLLFRKGTKYMQTLS